MGRVAYDETLATRVKSVLSARAKTEELRVFGGLAFTVNGHVCCGIVGSDLMLRVGPELYSTALSRPHARPMDFTGRPSKTMVYIAPQGLSRTAALKSWLGMALDFVTTLKPKSKTLQTKKKTVAAPKTRAKPASKPTKKRIGKRAVVKKVPTKATKKRIGKRAVVKKVPTKATKKRIGKRTVVKKVPTKATKKATKKATAPRRRSSSKVAAKKPTTKVAVAKQRKSSAKAPAKSATRRPAKPTPKAQRVPQKSVAKKPTRPASARVARAKAPQAKPAPAQRAKSVSTAPPKRKSSVPPRRKSSAPPPDTVATRARATRVSIRPAAAPARQSLRPRSMPPLAPFTGFPQETQRFLKELNAHNDKAWFDEHRADYESFYLRPALEFIAALGPELKRFSPDVQFAPRINGSLFRIQRDIRFSKDKTPYKAHIDLWFWHGDRKDWSTPGYFFRLEPGRLSLGGGTHRFQATQVENFREAIVDAERGSELEQTLAAIQARKEFSIGGASRKAVPKGFDPDHHRAWLLLHEGLYASYEGPAPTELHDKAFVGWCTARFEALSPLVDWLLRL